MNTTERINSFACDDCGYWEEMPADQARNKMSIALVELGESDEQYGKYRCTCGNTQWSSVVESEQE